MNNDKDYTPSAIRYNEKKEDSSKVYEDLKQDYYKTGTKKNKKNFFIILIIIIMFINPIIFFGFFLISFFSNTASGVFDIIGSTSNEIIEDVKKEGGQAIDDIMKKHDIDTFNININKVGLVDSLIIKNMLNEVVTINDSRSIIIKYNDIEYTKDIDILENISLKLQSNKEYIVTNEKDEEGYIIKIIIK